MKRLPWWRVRMQQRTVQEELDTGPASPPVVKSEGLRMVPGPDGNPVRICPHCQDAGKGEKALLVERGKALALCRYCLNAYDGKGKWVRPEKYRKGGRFKRPRRPRWRTPLSPAESCRIRMREQKRREKAAAKAAMLAAARESRPVVTANVEGTVATSVADANSVGGEKTA